MPQENLDERLQKLRIDRTRKQPRRSKSRWIKLVLVLAVAGAAGGFGYQKWTAPMLVRTAPLEREAANGQGTPVVTATGYVVPRNKIEVSSKVIGRVKEIQVERGALVKQDDVLLTLEDEEFRARSRAAEAQAAALEARLAELRAGSRPQEIAAAQAAAAAALATRDNAEREVSRVEALDTKGMVSKQELDRARTALNVAEANLKAQRKSAELVELGPRAETIAAAEAQWNAARAELEYAQTELSYTVIRAPIYGTILEKLAERGELVTNMNFGGTRGAKSSLLSMADLSDLQVEVDINEGDLSKVHLGQKTQIRIDANPSGAYLGEVDEIAPQADRQKGSVQVKVRVDNPDAFVKTELNARVTFLEASPEGGAESAKPHLWLPAASVTQRAGRSVVFAIVSGKAVEKEITLGAQSERGMELLEGLSETDTVILNPPETLVSGMAVQTQP